MYELCAFDRAPGFSIYSMIFLIFDYLPVIYLILFPILQLSFPTCLSLHRTVHNLVNNDLPFHETFPFGDLYDVEVMFC